MLPLSLLIGRQPGLFASSVMREVGHQMLLATMLRRCSIAAITSPMASRCVLLVGIIVCGNDKNRSSSKMESEYAKNLFSLYKSHYTLKVILRVFSCGMSMNEKLKRSHKPDIEASRNRLKGV